MITDYQSLRDEILAWLNRTDLTAQVRGFIQNAERRFIRDKRARRLAIDVAFEITEDGVPLPANIQSLEAWQHDGPMYFAPMEIVGYDRLGALKVRSGRLTGPPAYAALVGMPGNLAAYFAPAPDDTYPTKMTYWETITPLNDGNPTNWLLDAHPDIYLYGSLVQAEMFLVEDERLPMWKASYEELMEELHKSTWNAQFSGSMVPQRRTIG